MAAAFPFDSVEQTVVYESDTAPSSTCTPPIVDLAPFLCVSFCSLEVPRLLVTLSSVESVRLPLTLGVP